MRPLLCTQRTHIRFANKTYTRHFLYVRRTTVYMALCARNAHNTVYDVTTWSSVKLVNPVCFFAATYRKFQMRINILNVLVQGNAWLLMKRRVSNCSGDGSSSSTLFVTAVTGRPSTPGCLQIVPIIHAGLKSLASGKARA